MSERKDWKRLRRTRASKDDSTNRFPTPKDVVEGLVRRYGHGQFGRGGIGPALELDSVAIHGMYSNSPDGRFLDTTQAMELADSVIDIHGFYGKGGDGENSSV
jgi:hypothetical protein